MEVAVTIDIEISFLQAAKRKRINNKKIFFMINYLLEKITSNLSDFE
jgi:hypothetical protein